MNGQQTQQEPNKVPQLAYPQEAITDLELKQLRQQVSKTNGTRRLHMILDSKNPKALIQSMPPQEFLYNVKEVGLSDSPELIQLATKKQITHCLDLDCWKKDRIVPEQIAHWLQFLPIEDYETTEAILGAFDTEVLIVFLQGLIRIHERPEEDELPPYQGEIVETQDRFYIIELLHPAEDPRNVMARAIIKLFQLYGFNFAHSMFEATRWSLTAQLEEQSYQFRKARMEDIGFMDYYDAISIYQPIPKHKKQPAPPSGSVLETPLPILQPPKAGGLFAKALRTIQEPELQERISFELAYITNKILIAEQADPGNPQAAKQMLRTIQQTLDIGLESLEGNDHLQAAMRLRQHHVEWIFRVGYTHLFTLRSQGRKIAKDERFTLAEEHKLSLLPSPYIDLLRAVRHQKPRFFAAFDKNPGNNLRPFRSMADIQKSEEVLGYIRFLPTLFFERFPFSHSDLVAISQKEEVKPEHSEDLKFTHIFLTALAQFSLHGSFALKPLKQEELQAFLKKSFVQDGEAPRPLSADFQKQVSEELFKFPFENEKEKGYLQQFLDDTWKHLQEEGAYLSSEGELDTRFVSLFLVEG